MSEGVQSANWTTRRDHSYNFRPIPSPKTEDQCPNSKMDRGKKTLFLLRFCSSQAFNRLDVAHPHWEGNLLYPAYQMLIPSRNTFIETPRIVFDRGSGHPMGQSN